MKFRLKFQISKATPMTDTNTPIRCSNEGVSLSTNADRSKVNITCDCMTSEVKPAATPNLMPMNANVKVRVPRNIPIWHISFHGKPFRRMKNISGNTMDV